MGIARVRPRTAATRRRLGISPAALRETLHPIPLRFHHRTQFMHLAGEHADLLAQIIQSLGPAPWPLGHRARSGRPAGRLRMIAGGRAAHFRRPSAFAVARPAIPRLGPPLPRRKPPRLRALALVTTDFGARIGARLVRIRFAGFRARLFGIRPAGLGVFARLPIGFAVPLVGRLVGRLGIRRARETQGREHGEEEWSFHGLAQTLEKGRSCRQSRPLRGGFQTALVRGSVLGLARREREMEH